MSLFPKKVEYPFNNITSSIYLIIHISTCHFYENQSEIKQKSSL